MKKNIKFALLLIVLLFISAIVTYFIIKSPEIKEKVNEVIKNDTDKTKDNEPEIVIHECRKKTDENDYYIVNYIEEIETLEGRTLNSQMKIEMVFHNESEYKMYKDSIKETEEKTFIDDQLTVKYLGGEKKDYTKNEDGTDKNYEYDLFLKDLINAGYTCK